MKRKDFLKSIGLAGAITSIPSARLFSEIKSPPDACTLIPSETAGPFPLDLTENIIFFRQDLKETQTGVPLNVKLKIIGKNNCEPMPNARVNIWHCTKDGLYSGYSNSMNQGQAGLTYLRGYQYTDANGIVEFKTIFPGWYNGRICHIHFQVHVSSSYSAVSQLTFPISEKNTLYKDNATLYTKGADPLNFNTDNIFSDGHTFQLATLTKASNANTYDTYMEVTVQGTGTTGLGHLEIETSKIMELGQNFPNPYIDKTTIPLFLKQSAEVDLDIWDLCGKKVKSILVGEKLSSGNHNFEITNDIYPISTGSFIYEVTAKTNAGVFKTSKMMTNINK